MIKAILFMRRRIIYLVVILSLVACDRTSSPEGRMSIKLESLQKEMIDSLRRQNQAILDSLGKMRADIRELQQKKAN